MRYFNVILATATATVLSCGAAYAQTEPTARERARIERILSRTPLIDGHNDLPWEVRGEHDGNLDAVDLEADTRLLDPPLHTDFARLRQGGVGAQFWSVYVPASLKGLDNTEAVWEQIDLTRRIIARYPNRLEFADSADDIVRIHRARRIASMFGIEGGDAINENLALLREFRRAGVLYMTLTHGTTIGWVDSATDAPRHGGLSPFGEQVVQEMNRIGMFVDLSHVSADAMRDALRVSTAPVIFSHSSAYAIAHHPRNVPDDVLRLVHDNGGVVMVNFALSFISEEHRQWDAERAAALAQHRALNPNDPAAAQAGYDAWLTAHPAPPVTAAQVADHIEYIARVAGRDNVGFGADFDGVPALPVGMTGVEGFTQVFAELVRRGWSDADLGKLAGGNLLRAMRQMERVAARAN